MSDPTPHWLLTRALPLLLAGGIGFFTVGMTLLAAPLRRLAERLDRPRTAYLALGSGIVLYVLWIGAQSLARHWALETQTYDLGNVEQALWNTLRGDFFRMTTDPEIESNLQIGTDFPDLPDNRWAFHVEPILLLALPLYRLLPRPETLLVFQTLLLAAGAVPVYVAARALIGRRSLAVAFAWLYLLSPLLGRANLYDVHAFVFAVPLLLGAYALALRGRNVSAFVCAALVLACREDLAAPVAILAVIWIAGGPRLLGIATLALAFGWGALVFREVLPAFNPAGYIYAERLALADGPVELAGLAFQNPGLLASYLLLPERLAYYAYLVLPLALLPLAAPHLLALGLPVLVSVIFSRHGGASLLLGHYHYHAMILPGLLLAAMWGTAAVGRRIGGARFYPAALATMIALTIGANIAWRSEAGAWPRPDWARVEAASTARALIPPEASAAASYDLGAQIAGRRDLFTLYSPKRAGADYIFLSRCQKRGCDGLARSRYDDLARTIRADPAYEVIFDEAGITLLRRKR